MRKILLSSLLMFLVFGLAAQEKTTNDAMNFVSKFEKAVLTHNYDSVMSYMDAKYVKAQYKKLLKKNQIQFIDEFFGGYENIETSTGFINTKLAEISGIEISKITSSGKNQFQVIFKVTCKAGTIHYNQVMLRFYKKHFGFFGAQG